MEKKMFFMVYVEGQRAPEYKHRSLKEAEAEAKRLAKLTERRAFVLATVKSFEVLLFDEQDCRPNDLEDLPF